MNWDKESSTHRLGVGPTRTGVVLTPVEVIDSCIELINFVWQEAESLRREVGFGWRLADDSPSDVSGHLKAIATSTVSGDPLPVPTCTSRPFLSAGFDGALAFWGSINRFRRDLAFRPVDDLNLSLWQVAVAKARALSPTAVMLLEADLVGGAFLRAAAGVSPASRRAFALDVLTFGIGDAVSMEIEHRG